MNRAKVLGLVGWSGSGKTTLIIKLIPELNRRGLKVATLKHAHHNFDVDKPGKDSYEHRKAGASEVIVSSALRWAQMHEVGDGREATLAELLQRLSPCDLVLVEGFKTDRHPKLEVFRKETQKTPLYPRRRLGSSPWPAIRACRMQRSRSWISTTSRPLQTSYALRRIVGFGAGHTGR